LALNLCRRGAPLEQLRRAIWLGCARKYTAMLNGQTRLPITSLSYFACLTDEVTQPQIPASYWEHVRRKTKEMEKRRLQMRTLARAMVCSLCETIAAGNGLTNRLRGSPAGLPHFAVIAPHFPAESCLPSGGTHLQAETR
jgi:hypothetical protein